MAELEVDQTNLPRVQEVCQCFAVLEDGALAHNLQEQEIEQYYSSNVQRNQLVQNDIRVAKRLQDEEQERAYTLQRQSTQQLEEQDSEYARRIQEELQRCAEETLRREIEDEEIAKRIQEEEELLVRQRLGCQRTADAENSSLPTTRHTLQPERPLLSEEEGQYDWASHRQACSPSPSTSDYEEDHPQHRGYHSEYRRGHVEQRQRPGCDPPCRNSAVRRSDRSSTSQSGHLGQGSRSSISQSRQLMQGSRSFISQSSQLGQSYSSVDQSNQLRQKSRSSTSQNNQMRQGSRSQFEQDTRSSISQSSQLGQSYSSVDQNGQLGQNSRSSLSQSSQIEQDHRSSVSQSSQIEQDRRSSVSQSSQIEQDRRGSVSQSSQIEQDRRRPVSQSSQIEQDRRGSVSQSSQIEQDRRRPVSQSSQIEQDHRSSVSQSSSSGRFQGGWGDVVRLIKNDLSEQGYLSCNSDDELFEPVYRLERMLSQRQQIPDQFGEREVRLSRHSSVREASGRTWQERAIGRTQSFRSSTRSDSRSVRSEGRPVRRYNSSCSDSRSGDSRRHVHFQDESRRRNGYSSEQRAFEGGTRDREVGNYTVSSYPVRTQRGLDQVYPTTANGDQYQSQASHPRYQVRNVYQKDVHGNRRAPIVEVNQHHSHNGFPHANENHSFESSLLQESRVIQEEENEEFRQGSCRGQREPRRRAHSLREDRRWEARDSRRYSGNYRERRVQQGNVEDSSSTEEEEMERERRREERRARRLPQRSLSLACGGRSSRAGPALRRNEASLDMGELEQVLLDEELARRLQEEEETLLRGDPQSTPVSALHSPYPEGDFRVAQVAQDEEIARFMQKQEIKAKRQSRELEGCGTGRQYREMTNDPYDDRAACGRQVQRERLDSEGLLSPTEDFSPEHQPPSPIAMAAQQDPFRNIAEELDPTFHRKENMQAGPNISGPCQVQATPQTGSCGVTQDPAFVQPTKRQNDKPVRVKTKEKKENTRPKENCKQQ
ncbi:trichohyalin-like isoform X1 [Astyanax mexicanus]|uniref:Trichohyalin-like isoform X1 n=1 Tax=Astyanax mexicanus TaxID=7994 RepID=A0A8T2LLH5_ASTMX|nr:trichohyalin-like isoform X1 [Astyanax mexicanus]